MGSTDGSSFFSWTNWILFLTLVLTASAHAPFFPHVAYEQYSNVYPGLYPQYYQAVSQYPQHPQGYFQAQSPAIPYSYAFPAHNPAVVVPGIAPAVYAQDFVTGVYGPHAGSPAEGFAFPVYPVVNVAPNAEKTSESEKQETAQADYADKIDIRDSVSQDKAKVNDAVVDLKNPLPELDKKADYEKTHADAVASFKAARGQRARAILGIAPGTAVGEAFFYQASSSSEMVVIVTGNGAAAAQDIVITTNAPGPACAAGGAVFNPSNIASGGVLAANSPLNGAAGVNFVSRRISSATASLYDPNSIIGRGVLVAATNANPGTGAAIICGQIVAIFFALAISAAFAHGQHLIPFGYQPSGFPQPLYPYPGFPQNHVPFYAVPTYGVQFAAQYPYVAESAKETKQDERFDAPTFKAGFTFDAKADLRSTLGAGTAQGEAHFLRDVKTTSTTVAVVFSSAAALAGPVTIAVLNGEDCSVAGTAPDFNPSGVPNGGQLSSSVTPIQNTVYYLERNIPDDVISLAGTRSVIGKLLVLRNGNVGVRSLLVPKTSDMQQGSMRNFLIAILIASSVCVSHAQFFDDDHEDSEHSTSSLAPASQGPPPPPPPPPPPAAPPAAPPMEPTEAPRSYEDSQTFTQRLSVDLERMRDDLSKYFVGTRNLETDTESLDAVKKYIIDTFQQIGLKHKVQTFDTEIPISDGVKGANVIAELRGINWNTAADKLYVVGAHYDTTKTSEGVNDNGSGVMAMLEIARMLKTRSINNDNCKHFHSVVFVAFDIQIREDTNAAAGGGITGSQYFIKSYLDPILKKHGKESFAGAIILDSVMNFNDSVNAQRPEGFKNFFPSVYETIVKDEKRGNSMFLLNSPAEDDLADDVLKYWNEASELVSGKAPLYKASVDAESASQASPEGLLHFLKQDHVPFWQFFRTTEEHIHLPAILLTDSGDWRQGNMKCYPNSPYCSAEDYLTDKRMNFLSKTIKALEALLSAGDCEITSGAQGTSQISSAASVILAVGVSALARFMGRL
ncbi:unnamed protein product [Notodromas monacha]|uniref:Peptidase M28 domain-containing protein n=1 Tax=Notodromas monacha TaxID=399045 RepID=A0A7R9GEF2_9CRUS|nr:unnamed protein product [Notodromas monacha]CAG0917798.1 unnamed protein product [Notodromas monacha]